MCSSASEREWVVREVVVDEPQGTAPSPVEGAASDTSAPSGGGPRGGAMPAVDRTIAVLRYLASQPRPVTAPTIIRALELPRSSTYRLLARLVEQRLVIYLPKGRRYGLGVGVFELGSAYLRHGGLERLGRPLIAELVERTGQTCHLGILDGRDVLYLVEEEPPGADALVTGVGIRLPAHLTASGRCLLAHLPPDQVTAIYDRVGGLSRRTGRGPRSVPGMRARFHVERRQGYSIEDGEITEGFASIAVAVRNHLRQPEAAVAVTFRAERYDEPARSRLVEEVRSIAAELTRRLGGGPRGG